MLTPKQATNLIEYLAAVFPHGKITEQTIPAYADALSDLDGEAVLAAARGYAKRGTFFPTPGALRELVEAGSDDAPMPWDEAWAMALESVSPRGYGKNYDWPPLVMAAINAIGGFKAIGATTETERPFKARLFREAYESRCHQAKRYGDQLEASGEVPRLPDSILRLMGGFGTVPASGQSGPGELERAQ